MELLPELVELWVELNREELKVLFSDDDVVAKIWNELSNIMAFNYVC